MDAIVNRRARTAIGIILALMLSSFLVAPSAGAAALSHVERTERAINTIFVQTNQFRREVGAPPLKYDAKVAAVAQRWAQQMHDNWDAQPDTVKDADPFGSNKGSFVGHGDWSEQLGALGFSDAAEIAAGSTTGKGNDVMVGWRYSPGHYRWMVEPEFTHVGIGVYIDSDGYIWAVQQFVVSSGAASDPVPGAGKPVDGTETLSFEEQGERDRARQAKERAATVVTYAKRVDSSVRSASNAYARATVDYKRAKSAYARAAQYKRSAHATARTKATVKSAGRALGAAKEAYRRVKEGKLETDRCAKIARGAFALYREKGWWFSKCQVEDVEEYADGAVDASTKVRSSANTAVRQRDKAKKSLRVKIAKRKASVMRWRSRTIKVNRGRAPKPQSVTVKSNVKRLYVETRYKDRRKGAKYSRWSSMGYVAVRHGKARVTFPGLIKSGSAIQFRVVAKATDRYSAVTTRPMTVYVK